MSDETGAGRPEGAESGVLEDRIAQLAAELDDARSRSLRVMADYQNYQRRALQNEITARQQGVAAVVLSVVPILDHFDVALSQVPAGAGDGGVLAGLKVIRDELVRALTKHGVVTINPQPNDEFFPGRHEAVMQQPGDGIFPNHIVRTFQSGYLLRDGDVERVLRPAKVVVAPSE